MKVPLGSQGVFRVGHGLQVGGMSGVSVLERTYWRATVECHISSCSNQRHASVVWHEWSSMMRGGMIIDCKNIYLITFHDEPCDAEAGQTWRLYEMNGTLILGAREYTLYPSLKNRHQYIEPISTRILKCELQWSYDHVCRRSKLCGAGKTHVQRQPLPQNAHDEREVYRRATSWQMASQDHGFDRTG